MIRYSFDTAGLDIDLIHRFLSEESSWARGIPKSVVEHSIAHSLCLGAYEGTAQVGFARLVTDYATFAYLCDVFVVTPSRGNGIAFAMMEQLMAHPAVAGARRVMLITSSVPNLYRQFGFAELPVPTNAMEILRADLYSDASK